MSNQIAMPRTSALEVGTTDTQLASIDAYVRFAEELPTELAAVKVYLGYDSAGDAPADPARVRVLFVALHAHAASWTTVATLVSEQLRALSSTADSVLKDGSGLRRGLEALPLLTQMMSKVGKAMLGADDPTSSVAVLDADTLNRLGRLAPYVDALQSTTLDALGDTDASTRMLADFRTQAAELEAQLADVVAALRTNSEQIGNEQTVEPMIAAFRDACTRIVAQFGEGSAAAEAIQRQAARTLALLSNYQGALQDRQRLTYAAGRLFVHLQGLGYATLDAQTALTRAWLTSAAAHARLAAAIGALARVNREDSLLTFYSDLQQTLRDWTQVRDDAAKLYRSF